MRVCARESEYLSIGAWGQLRTGFRRMAYTHRGGISGVIGVGQVLAEASRNKGVKTEAAEALKDEEESLELSTERFRRRLEDDG